MEELDKNIETSSQETDWFGNLFDNLQAALKQTAFKAIAPPGADLALKAARRGVQKAVGGVVTDLINPYGYGTKSYHPSKVEEVMDILKYSKEDPEYYDEVSSRATKRTKAREFPLRQGFGLPSRDNWEKIYKKNDNGTYRFSTVDELAKLHQSGQLSNKQLRAGLTNIMQMRWAEDGQHSQLMGSYEGSRNEDGSYNYYDKWDFAINEGEGDAWSKFKKWNADRDNVKNKKELLAHLSRVGISQIFDPVEFEGTVSEDEVYHAGQLYNRVRAQ
jgi:hypothetical protein